MPRKPYRLTEGSTQHQFQESRAKIQGFCGAFANGKSLGMIIKALRLVKDYPGCSGLMARATYPKLNDTLRKDFLMWCPSHWIKRRPTQDDNSVYFTNGSVIHFRYIAQRGKSSEDGTTTSNLLSATYDFIIVDQMEDPEIIHKDFLDLLGRLRGSTPYKPKLAKGEREDVTMPLTGPRWLMFGANPSRGWIYNELIRPFQQWKEKGVFSEKLIVDDTEFANDIVVAMPLMELYEGAIYENAENLEPDVIKTLEAAYKGQMRERFLLGKWAAFEGLVYSTFDETTHVLTRQQIMNHLRQCLARHVKVRVLESYDFGNVSPSCYLLAFVDDLGRVFILDGFYQAEFGYEFHPSTIMEIRDKYSGLLVSRDPIRADPSIYKKQVIVGQRTGKSLAELLIGLGLKMKPGHNNIQVGIAKVSSYWGGRIDVGHVVTGEMPGPMMYVCQDLTWYMDEIMNYFWKKNPQGDQIDEPMDRNDHAMDNTKYLLSALPEASKVEVPMSQLPPAWKFWHEVDSSNYKHMSRMQ